MVILMDVLNIAKMQVSDIYEYYGFRKYPSIRLATIEICVFRCA